MSGTDTPGTWIKDLLAWASDCRSQAESDIEPAAQDAFTQLADELEATALKMRFKGILHPAAMSRASTRFH